MRRSRWLAMVFWLLLLTPVGSEAQALAVPANAKRFQRQFIANARYVWGLDAPVRVMAAQVHQESAWRENAKSKYADGLAQFTPATATWISGLFPDLASNEPYNPAWAFRALARYDKFLFDRQRTAATPCDRWAFTLSAYNGGEGWVSRDKSRAAAAGRDSTRWFGHVEHHSSRAAWAFRENRGYPSRILLRLQPVYTVWGTGVSCEDSI